MNICDKLFDAFNNVNGPGEAAGADLGVSLGRGRAHLFKKGEIVRTVPEAEIVSAVLTAIEEW